MDIQPLADFITQNSSALTAGGLGTLAIKQGGKVLLERCSDYLGIVVDNHGTVKKADAEGKAEIIKARSGLTAKVIESLGEIELSETEKRGLARSIREEGRNQKNIDSIVLKALQEVSDDAHPEDITDEWLNNFFDKAKLISDTEMQHLLSRILSGEANAPGYYTKRIVNLLSDMDRDEAASFYKICQYCVTVNGAASAFITDTSDDIYKKGEMFDHHVRTSSYLGLITFSPSGYSLKKSEQSIISYHGQNTIYPADIPWNVGRVALTRLGMKLYRAYDVEPIEGFFDFLKEQLEGQINAA